VFTRASTLPDAKYKGGMVKQGVYDYKVGMHTMLKGNRIPSEPKLMPLTLLMPENVSEAIDSYYSKDGGVNCRFTSFVDSYGGVE
jgi:hypothetical protein